MTTDAVSGRAVHPVAELFPMMSEEELAELAEDIRERGLLQPIVLGPDGEILDGRNRYAACKLADVEPVFETYGGDDPGGYALAVNVARRNLKPSQKHMIKEMARRRAVVGGLQVQKTQNSGFSDSKSEATSLSEAAVILDHAPDLAREVATGTIPLYKALEIALANKKRAREEAAKRDRLKDDAPDLLALVDDDQLSLDEAISALETRLEKARQEAERKAAEEKAAADAAARAEAEEAAARQQKRRTATLLLCKLIPALAEINGEDLAQRYDIDEQPADYRVTLGMLAKAADVLDDVVRVWQERELP